MSTNAYTHTRYKHTHRHTNEQEFFNVHVILAKMIKNLHNTSTPIPPFKDTHTHTTGIVPFPCAHKCFKDATATNYTHTHSE